MSDAEREARELLKKHTDPAGFTDFDTSAVAIAKAIQRAEQVGYKKRYLEGLKDEVVNE